MQIALDMAAIAFTVGVWSIVTVLTGEYKMTDEQVAAWDKFDRAKAAAWAELDRNRAAAWAHKEN